MKENEGLIVKKLFTILLLSMSICILIACGKQEQTNDAQTVETSDQVNATEKETKLESLSDDMIVVFDNEEFKKIVQQITGVTSRDLTYGDVKNITDFNESIVVANLESLKYFTGLKKLYVTVDGGMNLDMLEYLPNLESCDIRYYTENDIDINGLKSCANLKDLGLSMNITDLSVLEKLEKLESLDLANVKADLTPLGNLTNLKALKLFQVEVPNLQPIEKLINLEDFEYSKSEPMDFSPLEQCTKLKNFRLTEVENSNISFLSTMGEMKSIYINRPVSDLTPISQVDKVEYIYLEDVAAEQVPQLAGLNVGHLEMILKAGSLNLDILATSHVSDILTLRFRGEESTLGNMQGVAGANLITDCLHTIEKERIPREIRISGLESVSDYSALAAIKEDCIMHLEHGTITEEMDPYVSTSGVIDNNNIEDIAKVYITNRARAEEPVFTEEMLERVKGMYMTYWATSLDDFSAEQEEYDEMNSAEIQFECNSYFNEEQARWYVQVSPTNSYDYRNAPDISYVIDMETLEYMYGDGNIPGYEFRAEGTLF